MPVRHATMPVALVVDGDLRSARTADECLRLAGWTVLIAESRTEALAIAERIGTGLTVVIVDVDSMGAATTSTVAEVRSHSPSCGVVLLSRDPNRLVSASQSRGTLYGSSSDSGSAPRTVPSTDSAATYQPRSLRREGRLVKPYLADELVAAARGQIPTGMHFAVFAND